MARLRSERFAPGSKDRHVGAIHLEFDRDLLVAPDDRQAFVDALEAGLAKVAAHGVDQSAMREHYARNFDMDAAHRGWMRALRLEGS